jgi:hypothetical protein
VQTELLTIGGHALATLESWQTAYVAIHGAGVSCDSPNSNISGATISEVNTRIAVGLSALSQLNGIEKSELQAIAHRLIAARGAVDAIYTHAQGITATLGQWQGSIVTDLNGLLNLQVTHAERGSINYDLGSPLLVILQQANIILDLLPYISQVVDGDSVPVFEGLVKSATDHLAQAKSAAESAQLQLNAGKIAIDELKNVSAHASLLAQQIADTLSVVNGQSGAVESNAAEVVQKLAQIREVSKDADALQQRVTSFSAQFEAFDAQMKARLDLFLDFEINSKEAQRVNSEREIQIAEIINKADTMIRGATTAGLSKSLEDTRDLYERRLEDAQQYFLYSVAFLLVCTLPIAAQLVPGPWQEYFLSSENGEKTESMLWLSAIGKLILVIPGTWATAFFASNYAELFHLSREYAHKAALAKAIDGFQREAPTYKEEIVGSVFMEIQDNPGSRKAPSPARPENPVTKKFLEKVLEAIRVFKEK